MWWYNVDKQGADKYLKTLAESEINVIVKEYNEQSTKQSYFE